MPRPWQPYLYVCNSSLFWCSSSRLTLSLTWMTKTEFLLTISKQYPAESNENKELIPRISWSGTKFSKRTLWILWQTVRRITNEIWHVWPLHPLNAHSFLFHHYFLFMISLLLLYFFNFFRLIITNLLPLAFFSVQLFFLLFSDLHPLFHECQSLNFSFEKVFHCIGLRDVKIESTQLHGQDWSAHLIKWSDQVTNMSSLALPPPVTNTRRWTYVYRLVPKRSAVRGGR